MIGRGVNDQKVVYAYPYATELSARFHHSLVNLLGYDMRHRQRIGQYRANSSGANIVNARNEIVESFLTTTDADWLWWIDTDMVFEPDTVERLVRSAHPQHRPIVGALCFSWQQGRHAMPTLYTVRPDGKTGRLLNYPRDQLVEVDATGCGCLLVHRQVLEAMATSDKWPAAYQWFMESHIGDLPIGEDITFCLRARVLGFPIFVDTSIKIGHEKTIVVDEAVFDAQQHGPQPLGEPIFVVIPQKAGERAEWTRQLAAACAAEGAHVLVDDSTKPLHRKWNDGLAEAEKAARDAGIREWNVAILNNDLRVGPNFLNRLAAGLRASDDHWIAYPDHHGLNMPDGTFTVTSSDTGSRQTMSGWAFMVRGETGLRIDEQYEWWYGDSDLQRQVEAADKQVVCVGGAHAEHFEPMLSSMEPDRLAAARRDEARFAAKWGIDPATLWLAQHPEFGTVPR